MSRGGDSPQAIEFQLFRLATPGPFWYKVALIFGGSPRYGVRPVKPFNAKPRQERRGGHKVTAMARVCQVTGKRPVTGNNVSHANNRTKRRFLPNLHNHRFWVESEKRFVRLRVSSKGMRIIDKKGIDAVLKDIRARGENV